MAATIKDIARKTGLGLATISKYINGGNVRKENKALIDSAISELDFTVNEFARGLKSNKSKLIGVVIPQLSEMFTAEIISELESVMRKSGYSVIICDCHLDKKLECKLVDFLLSKRVDGIISMPVNEDGKHLFPALKSKIPVVVFDRLIEPLVTKADFVLADNKMASESAVEHLVLNGHRQIGIIAGPTDNYTAETRLNAFISAAEKHGVTPEHIFRGDYTVQGGFNCMKRILEGESIITAVYATNYFMTLGAIMAMNEHRSEKDREISFIGFDNIELTKLLKPSPCMITQPMKEMGMAIADIMLRRLSGEELQPETSVITLPTSIEIGQSVHSLF